MAALLPQPPKIYMTGQGKEPDILPFIDGSSGAILAGDIIRFQAAGSVVRCATNDHGGANVGIVGLSVHGASDIYVSSSPTDATLFGVQASPYAAGDSGQVHAVLLHNNQPLVMSLKEAWALNLMGTSVGINLDASGFYVASTAATQTGVIVDKVQGINSQVGIVGDTFALVVVEFLPSVLGI